MTVAADASLAHRLHHSVNSGNYGGGATTDPDHDVQHGTTIDRQNAYTQASTPKRQGSTLGARQESSVSTVSPSLRSNWRLSRLPATSLT